MNVKRLIILLILSIAAGCAALGLEEAKSLSDRIAYAEGMNTALREASTDALNHAEISSGDMEHVQVVNQEVKRTLAAARALLGTDVASAEGRLLTAMTLLTELQTYLRSKGVKTSYNLWSPTWKTSPLLS